MSGSVNALRAIRKKLARGNDKVGRKGPDKKSSTVLVPAVGEPSKRKALSVSTPPDVTLLGSPNQQVYTCLNVHVIICDSRSIYCLCVVWVTVDHGYLLMLCEL